MASPPFIMEDQTDEDFFDKLVDDEVDGGGFEPMSLNNVGSNDEQAFANLSIQEVGTAPATGTAVDSLDNVDRIEGDCSVKGGDGDVKVEEFGAEGGGSAVTEALEAVVRESSDSVVGGDSESDSRVSGNSANAGVGIKEVQKSAISGVAQQVSFADIFNQIGDDSEDPFGEVADGFMVASGSLDGVSSNQVTHSTSYSLVHNGEDTQHASSIVTPDSLEGVSSIQATGSSSHIFGHNGEVPQNAPSMTATGTMDGVSSNQVTSSDSYSLVQNGEATQHALYAESEQMMPDQYSIQYWESLYPGWKYDPNTGQWYQVDGSDASINLMENNNANGLATYEGATANLTSDVYSFQHTAQSVPGSMTEESTLGTSSYWNSATFGNNEYPAHMIFDPQYLGWYYDTIALEWRSLESYLASINQSTSSDQNQQLPYGSASTANYFPEQNITYGQGEQVHSNPYQLKQPVHWRDSGDDMQPVNSEAFSSPGNTQYVNGFISNGVPNCSTDNIIGAAPYEKSLLNEQSRQAFDNSNEVNRSLGVGVGLGETSFQNFASAGNFQHNNHFHTSGQPFSATGFNGPNVANFTQLPLQNGGLSYSSSEGRSPDGRPSHALVSFGFGGKLIVMKDHSSLITQPTYASQDLAGGVINIHNLMEVATPKNDGSDVGIGDCEYFHTLSKQSFSGPLVSGNVGSKELNKWIDDRIASGNTPDTDYRDGEAIKMLLSLLKIACQYYGKLRSAYGTDHNSKENDCPESALAKLFSSTERNSAQFSAVSQCLQNMPSEGQMKATAEEVQMLLVSGRKMEALQCAQNGHLWGPAIVIATLLGEQFYGETVKQMALHQLVAGSPLRTLCLLIAGHPAEVFSTSTPSNAQNGVNAHLSGVGPGFMLDEWKENLAMISANRTKGDELVITHLGDCLWREKDEVAAAHICYLVAESNVESYSESARLCLVGANHLKYPRTYASPQAIQRTELYEYAKVLGNSQSVLLPFQPYKLLYACMLAEVGKMSDSLKYCQAVLKSAKIGRSPEVDAWRHMVSSLEERIKIHQQGGYATNFGGAKLVGKLLNFFDNTAHRVVGGLPPPTPATSQNSGQHMEHDNHSKGPRVSSSQSTMAMSSLMTSASAEGSNRMSVHNRSMSEPNFGRGPGKDESPKSSSSSPRDHTSVAGSSSRFGRFGSQIFQKTVGLVLKSRSDRQAKLGESNKFYYDEKLKRWVEEGAEPQAEEMTLAPPPTTTAYMNGMLDHNKKDESISAPVHANGEPYTNFNGKSAELPPIPSGSNHFSARGRMSVRSRYVDTFNKFGGTPANSFQSPSPIVPAIKPAVGNPNFFIPTPVSGGQETDSVESTQQTFVTDDNTTTSNSQDSFSSPQMFSPQSTINRHPSMDKGVGNMINSNGSLPPNTRRTLSWGEGLDLSNHTGMNESRSPGAPGFPQST